MLLFPFSRPSIIVCVGLLLSADVALGQQAVVIDWPSRQPTSPPITVDKVTRVLVSVRNVNDMLYSYSERIVGHSRIVPDTQFSVLPGASSMATTDPCKQLSDALTSLDTAFAKPELQPDASNVDIPKSISLEATRSAYDAVKSLIPALDAAVGTCPDAALLQRKSDYQTKLKPDWDAAESKSHVFEFSATLEPLTDYSIYLREKYVHTNPATHTTTDKTTDACTAKDPNSGKLTGVECEVVYQPRSTTITTSGGFLITEMPAPTYTRQNVPNSMNAVLVVNNTGPVRTAFTALINVKLPLPWKLSKICPDDDSVFGCDIAVGPAFQLSSTQQATRIGLFAGVGFHLWRYLYITPGAHIGQYDDFPAGFTAAGQPIPASFTGNLQPTTKTTVRFALALSFKGWDLLHKNAASQGTTKNGSATNPVTK